MTAQVAVFNLNGVAVASDSTTTISNSERSRTFSGAQKLFDLGSRHRAVVMTSGEARFMRIPYAVLIPKWRDSLVEPLPGIEDYAKAFQQWLPTQASLFGNEQQEWLLRWLIEDYYLFIRSSILRALHDHGLSDAPWDDPAVARMTTNTITELVEALAEREDRPLINEKLDAAYVASQRALINEALEYVFDDTPRSVAGDDLLVSRIPLLVLTKRQRWEVDSTVAFIGYGADDTFPGHQVVEITGVVDDRLRVTHWDLAQTGLQNQSVVTPFAQTEAINTFLRAYNYEFADIAHEQMDAVVGRILELPDLGEGAQASIQELLSHGHEDLRSAINSHSWDQFISPMLSTVESLPVGELARMAESLVGIQALRSHSSDRQPSVGGAIALVTIAPDTGVTWHRRHSELG